MCSSTNSSAVCFQAGIGALVLRGHMDVTVLVLLQKPSSVQVRKLQYKLHHKARPHQHTMKTWAYKVHTGSIQKALQLVYKHITTFTIAFME